MYEDYEFSEQFMSNMTHDIEGKADIDDIQIPADVNFKTVKQTIDGHTFTALEGKVEYLEDRIASLEKQYEQLQQLFEMIHKENEALKAYIKSGEKIIKLEKDF